MAKYFRGDTLPVVVSYDGYKFKRGDNVTVGVFSEDMARKYAEVSVDVTSECDEVQVELSREDTREMLGNCVLEARTISGNTEMTIQKEIEFKEDGLR